MYVGIALVLPVIIYHLYRFLEPLMDPRRKRSAFFYIMASMLLAGGGAAFAYFAGLPAALHFLTSFNIQNVSAMLTADSYLTFVITYVLGFAALFQIPLVLMIINTIKPLPPKKLLGFQRFVILVAFILAAIISPTPDITNQAMLAVPIIVMYQIGVLLVWLQSRKHSRSLVAAKKAKQQPAPEPVIRRNTKPQRAVPKPVAAIKLAHDPKPAPAPMPIQRPATTQPVPVMDIMRGTRQTGARPVIPTRPVQPRRAPERRPLPRAVSIDGFIMQQT